jgi:hypothetical protein
MSANNPRPSLMMRLWQAVVRFVRPDLGGQVVTRMGTRPSP